MLLNSFKKCLYVWLMYVKDGFWKNSIDVKYFIIFFFNKIVNYFFYIKVDIVIFFDLIIMI